MPRDVVELQAVREYPCVSLLLTTTPGPRLSSADGDRLARLRSEAERRLAAEPASPAVRQALRRLHVALDEAVAGPTAAALAVFASPSAHRVVHLPVSVTDRVVVDPTFATRDLVRALQRRPAHLVLLLGEEVRLLADDGFGLAEVEGSGLPVRIRGSLRDRIRRIDISLAGALARRHVPVVVMGDQHDVAAFLRHSRHQHAIAGAVGLRGSRPDPRSDAVDELAARVRPVLEDFLGDRERAATDLLAQRSRRGATVSGLTACWSAVVADEPEMLVVEESLAVPARLSSDGSALLPTGDREAPDVLDDAVDELIELVLARGGWVSLVADGTLSQHGGVAVTLRRPLVEGVS